MISPILIQIIFWIAIIFLIFTAVIDFFRGESYRIVFMILILGPLVARIICELLMLVFRIQGDLDDIKNLLLAKRLDPKNDHLNE